MLVTRRNTMLGMLAATALPYVRTARAADSKPIRLVGAAPAPTPSLAYFYLNAPTHFDEKCGVKTEFTSVAGSVLATQLLAGGHGDIATLSPLDMMLMKQKQPDLPVRAVYKLDFVNGNDITVPMASTVKTLADLKGKTIGVQGLASVTVAHAKALMRAAGVPADAYSIVAVGVGAQAAAALKTDQVQALCLQRSQIGGLENLGMEFRYFTPPGSSSIFVASEDAIKNRRDDLVRALRSITLSLIFAELNPTAAVNYFWGVSGQPNGDRDKALHDGLHILGRNIELWKPVADARPWGGIGDSDWKTILDFLGPDSGIDAAKLDYSKFYPAELIPEINALDVSIATQAAKEWKAPV